ATRLPSGFVLVAGGADGNGTAVASAALYDPQTRSWTPTGSLAQARYDHSATLLPNGKVLIAGGQTSSLFRNTGELYDPATGTFSPAGSFSVARSLHGANLLPSGKVLIAGGAVPESTAAADLYDP